MTKKGGRRSTIYSVVIRAYQDSRYLPVFISLRTWVWYLFLRNSLALDCGLGFYKPISWERTMSTTTTKVSKCLHFYALCASCRFCAVLHSKQERMRNIKRQTETSLLTHCPKFLSTINSGSTLTTTNGNQFVWVKWTTKRLCSSSLWKLLLIERARQRKTGRARYK